MAHRRSRSTLSNLSDDFDADRVAVDCLGEVGIGGGGESRLTFTPYLSPIRVMPITTTDGSVAKMALARCLAARASSSPVIYITQIS